MGAIDKRYTAAILCAIGAGLAVIAGGQVLVDAQPFNGEWMSNLLGGMELPLLSHTFVLLFFVAALVVTGMQKKVVQVPHFRLVSVFGFFTCVLAISMTVSQHRNLSAISFLEWVGYLMAMVAVVATTGRGKGPQLVLGGIAVGGFVLAANGLMEYGTMKALDPNWRIMGTWNNPNANAGMLVICFFAATALFSCADRVGKLLWGGAASFIGLAIFLTQSKGGFIALLFGGLVWAIAAGLKAGFRPMARGLIPFVLVLVLSAGLIASQKAQSAATPGQAVAGSRIADVGSSADQSSGFRKLLWKSSILLVQEEPLGVGLGTFRAHSSRPGLVTQTQFAHNSLLQLAVEATVLAPLALLVGLVMWLRASWKTSPDHWESHRLLSAGVLAAVAGSFAHGMVDSDLYYFGTGIVFFMLLGVGLQLGVDGTTPEFMPRPIRVPVLVGGSLVVLAGLGYYTLGSIAKGRVAGARAAETQPDLTGLGIAAQDGEARYMEGAFDPALTPEQRIEKLKLAVAEGPNQKPYRFLARVYLQENKTGEAIGILSSALRQDPNNLTTLKLLAESYRQNADQPSLTKTLDRLIAVESTPYFQVRAIPEMVPLETYEARVERSRTLSGAAQVSMLQPVIEGYRKYLALTFPQLLSGRFDLNAYGGSVDEALAKLEKAEEAIRMIRAAGGEDDGVKALESAISAAREAAAKAKV